MHFAFGRQNVEKSGISALQRLKQIPGCFLHIQPCMECLFYFKMLAAQFLTASEIYPMLQGANLIASAVLAQLLLKEKITPRCLAGMSVAFVGLLFMNFG